MFTTSLAMTTMSSEKRLAFGAAVEQKFGARTQQLAPDRENPFWRLHVEIDGEMPLNFDWTVQHNLPGFDDDN